MRFHKIVECPAYIRSSTIPDSLLATFLFSTPFSSGVKGETRLFLKEWVITNVCQVVLGRCWRQEDFKQLSNNPSALKVYISLEVCASMNPVWKQWTGLLGSGIKPSHPQPSSRHSLRRGVCVSSAVLWP